MGETLALALDPSGVVKGVKGAKTASRAVDGLTKRTTRVGRSFDKFQKGMSKAGQVAQKLGRQLNPLRLRNLAVALGAFGGSEFVQRVDRSGQAFDFLSNKINETSDALLKNLAAATKGTISDLNLMDATSKAVQLGIATSGDEIASLADKAQQLGKIMGLDASQSLDLFVRGLGRMSPLILDDLGLTVRLSKANEVFAKKMGISSASMDEAQRKTAFLAEALRQADDRLRGFGGNETSADKFDRLTASISNFARGIADAFGPLLARGFERMSEALKGFEPIFLDASAALLRAFDIIIPKIEEWVGKLDGLGDKIGSFARKTSVGIKVLQAAANGELGTALGSLAGGVGSGGVKNTSALDNAANKTLAGKAAQQLEDLARKRRSELLFDSKNAGFQGPTPLPSDLKGAGATSRDRAILGARSIGGKFKSGVIGLGRKIHGAGEGLLADDAAKKIDATRSASVQARLALEDWDTRMEEFEGRLDRVRDMGDAIGDSFVGAFTNAATGARSLIESLADLGSAIQRILVQDLVAAPLGHAISGGVQSLFAGVAGPAPQIANSVGGISAPGRGESGGIGRTTIVQNFSGVQDTRGFGSTARQAATSANSTLRTGR
jgi:hypothetical protein